MRPLSRSEVRHTSVGTGRRGDRTSRDSRRPAVISKQWIILKLLAVKKTGSKAQALLPNYDCHSALRFGIISSS